MEFQEAENRTCCSNSFVRKFWKKNDSATIRELNRPTKCFPSTTSISVPVKCAGEMCRKICRMMSVPCKTEISKAPEDYSYSPDKTYFVDTSGDLGKQKSVYDFFSKSVFAAKCFLAVPAIIDLQILSGILEQYSFLKDFQVVLTFCDFANDKKINQISEFFESRKIRIAARNTSGIIDGSLEFL